MEIKKVTIENFKCFKEQVEVEFGKLTLLTGANSSGKSSIIYSLLGPLQSGEFPYKFSTNGKYVNMGDFKEIIYNHNRQEKIKFEFSFSNPNLTYISTIWEEDETNNLPILSNFHAKSKYFDLTVNRIEEKYSINFHYNPIKDPQQKLFTKDLYRKIFSGINEVIETNKKSKLDQGESVEKFLEDLTAPQDIKNLLVDEIPFLDSNDIKGTYKLKQIFELISNIFNEYDEKINFISSFRLHPDRTYLEQTKTKLKVNNYGDGYLDQIMVWESKDRKKFDKLIYILKSLELLQSIESKRLEGGRFEITVQTRKDGVKTSLSDVGFGISQFLPIIVADIQLPEKSTLFIAQPEIHLHPSVQSSFGDYLIGQINEAGKNYIIETHSEYLLNKIRLGIVKKQINEKDVKILFIDNLGNIHKITFNKEGQILNAPDDFFKTYMMDVMEIAISAAEE